MKRGDQQDLIAARKRLLRQAALVIEQERCGPNLVARCGCTFVPWKRVERFAGTNYGIGLVFECDQAHRLFEIAIRSEKMAQWETHVYLAREDADNKLVDLVRLLTPPKQRNVHPDKS